MPPPSHIAWLQDTGQRVATACGRQVEIWELRPQGDEAEILSAWARQFRANYCNDVDLPVMAQGTGLTHSEYCRTILFPDAKAAPGPSVRAGDFAEMLVADYIEYVLGYWCPRELRYQGKFGRNDSTKGCDVVGFKFDGGNHANDEMFIYESKAGLAASKENRLQIAVQDSMKDRLREAMTLNALKRRLYDQGKADGVAKIERFQNEVARPFRRVNGAAAVLDDDVFKATNIAEVTADGHYNAARLRLLVIHGPSLMKLTHALYERAADEA